MYPLSKIILEQGIIVVFKKYMFPVEKEQQ